MKAAASLCGSLQCQMAGRNAQKADVILKDFWRQNERFADLFNAVIFRGKQVIKPEDLTERDTDMSGIIQFKGYQETLERTRDVVKKMAYGVEFAVLGIESQQKIHYAMPLRTMLYDSLGYLKEYQEITRIRKAERGKMTEDEFLSKMRKEDRLHPIISIVLYYSEKSWDGPTCLKDMIVEMPEEMERIFSDYKMNLVQIRESEQYTFHNEEVRAVFEISREIFNGNLDKINERYRNRDLTPELITVIGKITDSAELVRQGKIEEVANMCTALEKWEKENIERGTKRGIEIGTNKGIAKMVLTLLNKGKTVEETADWLDLTEEYVRKVQEESQDEVK